MNNTQNNLYNKYNNSLESESSSKTHNKRISILNKNITNNIEGNSNNAIFSNFLNNESTNNYQKNNIIRQQSKKKKVDDFSKYKKDSKNI